MLLTTAQQFALARFLANWTGTPSSQVVFEGEGHEAVDDSESPWVRVSVNETSGGQQTLGPVGGRKYRRRARVDVQVFTPVDKGTRPGFLLAEQARTIFEGQYFDDLYFFDCEISNTGKDEKWQQTLATVRFDFWETK